MDRGAWWATVHRVAKCQTRLKQLSTYACITVAMFAWVNLGSHIPFATRDILEVGLAWPYPWRVCYHSEYPEPPSPLQPGSWICWRKYKLLKNMWQKVTFERKTFYWRISSVQFSHSVVSDSLWPHESQHARPPCLSATPGVHPNSCALSQWCHPAISSSVVPLSFCPHQFSSVQFSSVAQSCPTLCNPMNCSMPGFPVHHELQEFTQTHVHRVGDAIQPSHPLLSPSPPAPNPSQHQSLFQWVNSLPEAKVLEFQL